MSINSRRVHGRDPGRPLFFTYCSLRNDNVTSATSLIYYAYARSRAGASAAFHGVDFPDYCFCNLEANLWPMHIFYSHCNYIKVSGSHFAYTLFVLLDRKHKY